MKSIPYLIVLFLVLFVSCENSPSPQETQPLKETNINKKLLITDSLDFNLGDSLHSRALAVVSENEIYFGSYAGRLIHLKISDDETNILHLNTPKNLEDIRGIAFAGDSLFAINSGDLGLIFSVKGWEHQVRYQYSDNTFLNGIQFWDAKRGIVFGDPKDGKITILTTEDGGKTWNSVEGFSTLTNEAGFSASNTAMQVGSEGQVWIGTGGDSIARLHFSSDYGMNWNTMNTPLASNASSGIFSVYFNGLNGIVVGGNYLEENNNKNVAAVTSDGGKSWEIASGIRGYRSCVSSNGVVTIATGRNGVDYSLDNGKNWKPLFDTPFYTVVVKDNYAWFIGKEGSIRRIYFEIE